ncbi:MAG: sulfotransferase family 2 domain-containing protein [Pseudomonadota bacterium]|nr:sulfotransferase family 2 domain-containing protein [Pseudomonadota bacterium]
MIVSHAHRFIYIKTYKTASTSIEAALSAVCGPDDVITPASEELMKTRGGREAQNYRLDHPMVPKRPLLRRLLGRPERAYHESVGYYEHMPAWRVRNYVGEEVWSSYYKFSFERNPWERQVSWFFFKTKSKRNRPEFTAFLQDRKRAYVDNFDLYAIGEDVCLDFVGRYENLAEDFNKAMQVIGLDDKVSLPVTNASPRQGNADYRELYDDAARERVADWYRREIRLFGYSF